MDVQSQMNPSSTNVSFHHGGHEFFDVSEVLAGTINVLDQFMMFRQYIQDKELLDILDRQYQHVLDGYNALVETFSTGQAPSRPHVPYQTKATQQVIYGIAPTQPKKPNASLADIKDKGISGHMLGLIKSAGSLMTMSAVEVTNPFVRRLMAETVPCYIEMAYEIFLYQNKHRYYQVPQLSQQDMTQMLNSFVTMENMPQMPQTKSLLQ